MMNGKDFLITARFLQRNGKKEADFRSIISRAYYACYLVTRDIAKKACYDNARKKALGKMRHENLVTYLKNHGPTLNVKMLGTDLGSLQARRNCADYAMSETITSLLANKAVEDADAFLSALAEISIDDIVKAVENYYINVVSPNM